MPTYTRRALAALEKMIYRYECAIEKLENGADPRRIGCRWEHYGSPVHCLLCVALTITDNCVNDCPINPCCTFEAFVTFDRLKTALRLARRAGKTPIRALRARLKFLVSQVDRNGYVLEEG